MKKDLLQVLVTGATGFVGRAVVSELVANGSQVKALVRKPSALPFEDGAEIQRILDAAFLSFQEGRKVDIKEIY